MSAYQDLTGKRFGSLFVHQPKHHRDKKGISRLKWECICDCGNLTRVSTQKLKSGHTKSCGCLRNGKKLGKILGIYKRNAYVAGREFSIPYEEFVRLIQFNCFYCGCKPDKEYKDIKHLGIDRLHNELGYIPGNCVPCCETCNRMKGSLPTTEFVLKTVQISEKLGGAQLDEERSRILLNAARCLKCGDIVISRYRHDFVSCSCGEIFVDGGRAYIRRGAKDMSNIEEMSVGWDR